MIFINLGIESGTADASNNLAFLNGTSLLTPIPTNRAIWVTTAAGWSVNGSSANNFGWAQLVVVLPIDRRIRSNVRGEAALGVLVVAPAGAGGGGAQQIVQQRGRRGPQLG